MKVHGIEVAEPDGFWIALIETSVRAIDFKRVAAEHLNWPGYEDFDAFWTRNDLTVYSACTHLWRKTGQTKIYAGMTGTLLGGGRCLDEALVDAAREISDSGGPDPYFSHIITWLETHPLSPRYRWIGQGKEASSV